MLNNSNRVKSPKDKNWCISLGIKDKLSYVIIHHYTVTKKALGQGQNVNFFDFFDIFGIITSKKIGRCLGRGEKPGMPLRGLLVM